MNEKELAAALYQAGLLTREQIQAAAEQRTLESGFTDIVLRNGWVTREQIAYISGNTQFGGMQPINTPSSPLSQQPFGNSAPTPWQPTQSAPTPAVTPSYAPPIPSPTGERGTFGQSASVSGYSQSANGVLILALGIIGVFVVQFLAPVAWIMGNNSLRAIDAGRADPSDRGLVSAGRIMGIIGSVLLILVIGLLVLVAMLTMSGRRISNTFSPAPNMMTAPGGVQ